MEILIYSEEEILELGRHIARVLESQDTVYLIGELGAGKTTLVRGIARALNYKGRVNSPTFTLMNVYNSTPPIFHFDFYRLEGGDVLDIGLDDYLEREGIVLIEWPQLAEEFLPQEALHINIELVEDDYDRERRVIISGRGKRYTEKLERLKKYVDSSH